jgi:D-psicose/D-tagatose/L-ribulose 3-epimerase
MKIGMNLLLYTTQPDESIFPTCDKLRGMGFDGFEWPVLGTDAKTAQAIRKYNDANKLPATTVFVFGPGQSPISPNEAERKAALETLRNRIEITAALGADKLCGPIVQTLGQFTGQGPTKDERKRCVEFFQSIGDFAKSQGVTLVLEYLNRFEIYFLNTAADAAKLCDEIDHPAVKTMIDSFHANIEEKDLYKAVMAAQKHLVHVHISENDRGVPGSSKSIPWTDLFRGIRDCKYDGWLMIESFGTALPDLAAAAKIWRPLFDSPDDVGRDGIAFIKRMLAG